MSKGTSRLSELGKKILQCVLDGCQTTHEVVAMVGNEISAAKAIARWRRVMASKEKVGRGYHCTLKQMARNGKLAIVREVIQGLTARGTLRRISRGHYGPPLPKIHEPETMAS